jgi:hypothetical protein
VKACITIGLMVVTSGCASQQQVDPDQNPFEGKSTPYQPKSQIAGYKWGGYSSFPTGTGAYYVLFQGNQWTSIPTVVEFWHRRAAEVCPHGYDMERDNVVVEDEVVGGGTYGGQCVGGLCSPVYTEPKTTLTYVRMEGYARCREATASEHRSDGGDADKDERARRAVDAYDSAEQLNLIEGIEFNKGEPEANRNDPFVMRFKFSHGELMLATRERLERVFTDVCAFAEVETRWVFEVPSEAAKFELTCRDQNPFVSKGPH